MKTQDFENKEELKNSILGDLRMIKKLNETKSTEKNREIVKQHIVDIVVKLTAL